MLFQVNAPFWCPKLYEVNGEKCDVPLPEGAKFPFFFTNSEGLMYEAQEVRECLKKGLKQSPKLTWDESRLIAEIQEEIHRQIEVKY